MALFLVFVFFLVRVLVLNHLPAVGAGIGHGLWVRVYAASVGTNVLGHALDRVIRLKALAADSAAARTRTSTGCTSSEIWSCSVAAPAD